MCANPVREKRSMQALYSANGMSLNSLTTRGYFASLSNELSRRRLPMHCVTHQSVTVNSQTTAKLLILLQACANNSPKICFWETLFRVKKNQNRTLALCILLSFIFATTVTAVYTANYKKTRKTNKKRAPHTKLQHMHTLFAYSLRQL